MNNAENIYLISSWNRFVKKKKIPGQLHVYDTYTHHTHTKYTYTHIHTLYTWTQKPTTHTLHIHIYMYICIYIIIYTHYTHILPLPPHTHTHLHARNLTSYNCASVFRPQMLMWLFPGCWVCIWSTSQLAINMTRIYHLSPDMVLSSKNACTLIYS